VVAGIHQAWCMPADEYPDEPRTFSRLALATDLQITGWNRRRKIDMKTKLIALLVLAGGTLLAQTHFSIGVGIGVPYAPPPPPAVAYMPPCPGPQYIWVPGYYYPAGPRFVWRAGYWARPPYAGAYWVAPRYYQNHYYAGYWGRGAVRPAEHHDNGRHRGWYK